MLRRQISSAKRQLAELPQWLRDLMRWEGGDRTGLNQAKHPDFKPEATEQP
jgi:hypothetical protein